MADPAHKIVYLIDTINGKEQILQNYNARPLYHMWETELDGINFDNDMFETDKRIVIITYAKFGVLLDRDPDFHKHFEDGGHDYYPGEFVQDYVWVENVTYEEILRAYRTGKFYCTVANCIENPVFTCEKVSDGNYQVDLSFTANHDMDQVDIISDGICVCSLTDVPRDFRFSGVLPGKGYFRVRGWAKPVDRKYSEGQFIPQFLLNPIFL